MQQRRGLSERPCDLECEHLLARARAGEIDALGVLFAQISDQVERQARRFVAPHEVDDVVSETFVNVLQAIQGGAGPVEKPVQYVMFAVRTTAWRHKRSQVNEVDKARRHATLSCAPLEMPDLPDDELARALRSLPVHFQRVIWWTEIEGLTATEVGERLALSPNAAAALAYRARGALRRAYGGRVPKPT